MSKTRGNRSSAAQIASRRKTELELLAQGETQTSIAKALDISRVTLWRDLLDIKKQFDTDLPEDFRKSLRAQVEKIKELIAIGRIADGRKVELLQRNVELEAKYGPKIELNGGSGNTTNVTVLYIDETCIKDAETGKWRKKTEAELAAGKSADAEGYRRVQAALAEGERERSVNKAIVMDTPLLEGKVEP